MPCKCIDLRVGMNWHTRALLSHYGSELAHVNAFMSVSFIHSFIQAISIAPLRVHYYPDSRIVGYCVGVSRRSATDNCERRPCPMSLHGG